MNPSLTSTIVEQRQSGRLASAARHRLLAEATVQRTIAPAVMPVVAAPRRRWLARRPRPIVTPAS